MRTPRDRNRRRAPRVRVANLVGYSDRRSDSFYTLLGSATTVDMSETGVRLRTSEPLPIGSTLTFDLKIGSEIHRVDGRVIWGEELVPDTTYEFGVNFAWLTAHVREQLKLYVSIKQQGESSSPD
jgi:hypothetical protein